MRSQRNVGDRRTEESKWNIDPIVELHGRPEQILVSFRSQIILVMGLVLVFRCFGDHLVVMTGDSQDMNDIAASLSNRECKANGHRGYEDQCVRKGEPPTLKGNQDTLQIM